MSSRFVEVSPGVRLHVVDLGAGPPVVLLAGFGLDHEVWDAQIRELSAEHRVVAVDLRGTGRSSKPISGYEMSRLAADVAAVLSALELTGVSVVGHSFGAQIGLCLVGLCPERVQRLVMVCSNGVRASRSDDFPFGRKPDEAEEAAVRAERSRRPAARRASMTWGFHRSPDPDLVDWLVRCQLRMPSWAAIPCYHTYLHTDLIGSLPGLTVPVRQIVGVKDPVTPVAGAEWVQRRLPDGGLVRLDDCGHFPMFETPSRFDAALTAALAN